MDGKVLGVERRRRWSRDEKARIVEETLAPGAVVSDVARRHGVSQSLLFTWRRLARTADPAGSVGSILLPVEIDAMAPAPLSEAARPARQPANGRRSKPGVIEIDLSGFVATDAALSAKTRRFLKRLTGPCGQKAAYDRLIELVIDRKRIAGAILAARGARMVADRHG